MNPSAALIDRFDRVVECFVERADQAVESGSLSFEAAQGCDPKFRHNESSISLNRAGVIMVQLSESASCGVGWISK